MTNNFELDAEIIALLYKNRWRIEIFFKWIKQNLRIEKFWGEKENAVQTQIWVGICTYAMVAILKKSMKIDQNMYEMLQILSICPFDKAPVNQLFMKPVRTKPDASMPNQLKIWDL